MSVSSISVSRNKYFFGYARVAAIFVIGQYQVCIFFINFLVFCCGSRRTTAQEVIGTGIDPWKLRYFLYFVNLSDKDVVHTFRREMLELSLIIVYADRLNFKLNQTKV